MDHHVEEAADERPEDSRCGYLGAHGSEKLTGGPERPPAAIGYQVPPLGQAPVLVVVHVRVTVEPAFVIVKLLPEADCPTIV